jgi:hypothetical protein
MKLSDEQLEEVLLGQRPQPDDLDEAQQRQLAEAQAVRAQLDRPPRAGVIRAARRWLPLAAAAAALIALGPLLMQLIAPRPAVAAQAELAAIHRANLQPGGPLHAIRDRQKLEAFLTEKLGTRPALPTGDDVDFCGCCTARFRGRDVTSYMLDVAGERISVIIGKVDPSTLSFGHEFSRGGRRFWGCGSGKCRMVAMRLGDYTYFAVGETGHDALIDVLTRLLPQE